MAILPQQPAAKNISPEITDRLTPRYPTARPLDEIIRKVEPGLDAFLSERYAQEIEAVLANWSRDLRKNPREFGSILATFSPDFAGKSFEPHAETTVGSSPSLYIARCRPKNSATVGREEFIEEWKKSFAFAPEFLTAEFNVVGLTVRAESPLVLETRVRYDAVSTGPRVRREQRVGEWKLEWIRNADRKLAIRKWDANAYTLSRSFGPMFSDITTRAMGGIASYRAQLLRGTDYWRTTLDGACGIDVYGNNGIACGDFDNDGYDDLYVCQPSGLPNRLYRNCGDGTFQDVTEQAGVGVLDNTACALFADVDNDGYQDLIVVRASGPLLFGNLGSGKFQNRPDAFRFARPPEGTFTAAAVADYDRDGWLDIYFCLYSYYQGLDQYRFPTPYHDAQNGPPNFLLRNNRDGTFSDATAAAGLNQNNNRYSFACGWCDYNDDGWPDLYVANDFGRKNLYRNNGNGTFTDVAAETGVEDFGAGMSVCWFDYDNDGRQDLYVSNMWSAAGNRVTMQETFMKGAGETIRGLYRKHAGGNSLFRNTGDGRFEDAGARAEVEMGRWAWAADAWDFDHDGYPDLYIANGMVSGPNPIELNSFFWRQVVAQSPLTANLSRNYEQGWNAINELIRSDSTWSGYERNTFYANNRNGTFSDVSGVVGLDFADDSRAFALSDFDHDGRLEIFLKNRTAPELRILRNDAEFLGRSIAFRLRSKKSNRDAIGAAVTVETENGRQVNCIRAGSGFLSQHSKEIFFGLGDARGPVRASVRWPSGMIQHFENLSPGHRVEIEEGSEHYRQEPFAARRRIGALEQKPEPLPERVETWLIEPLAAPEFALPDLAGREHTLAGFRGRPVLLNFWATGSQASLNELEVFRQYHSRWAARGLKLVAVNVNGPAGVESVRSFARDKNFPFLILLASEETAGIYNLLSRYLFDRRRSLGIPTSFLLAEDGLMIKVYQGSMIPEHLLDDLSQRPKTAEERMRRALPFSGTYYGGEFRRNHFTYGVAFLERGYDDQAIASFELALRNNPEFAEACYNLGTLYLKKKSPAKAVEFLRRAIELRPDYPDALNNLGLLAAEDGRTAEALRYFQEAIQKNPNYSIALQNLGNLYRRQGKMSEARQSLERALAIDPEDPEANYSLGMVFAQSGEEDRARDYLKRALKLRPVYPEALNNLGVLDLRSGKLTEAKTAFEDCMRADPAFDQPYLNLARVYVTSGDRKQAEEILRRLLERHPDHVLARQALEQLEH